MQAAKSLRDGMNKALGAVNVALFGFMVVVGNVPDSGSLLI